MKKILIMYATYGTGHKKIAEYIENYFVTHGDFQIEMIDILKYSTPFLGALTQKTFEKLNFSIPYLWDLLYNVFNRKVYLFPKEKIILSTFRNKTIQKKVLDFEPDIIISTHFFSSAIIAYYKRKKILNSKLITIVTDYEAHELWLENEKYEDYLILGNSMEKKELIQKGFPRKKILDTGIPLSEQFDPNKYNKEKIIKSYKFDNGKPILLFFCSRGKITNTYTEELIKSNLDCNIAIVTGNNSAIRTLIKEDMKTYRNPNIKVLGYVNNVPEFLNMADLVITKPGGATVTECLYFNKPILFIGKHSGQEKANARYLEKQQCAVISRSPAEMVEQIRELIKYPKKLHKLAKNTTKINKKDAMKKLYQLVNKMLED